jgi:hypothetical protein
MSCSTNGEPAMSANIAPKHSPHASAWPRNPRSASSRPNVRSVPATPPAWRRSAASVSGTPVAVPASRSTPITARTTNTPRHDVTVSTWPPSTGARIGAAPLTSMSSEKNRAASRPEYRSRTTARAITMPAAPASPWTKRSTTSAYTDGASAHSSDAAA